VRAAEQAAVGGNCLSQSGEAPSERLEREERCRQVRFAISQLPEEYRVVLVLREMEGYCYETIAEVLDLPVGTVRSRLHRGRMQLREQLREVLAVEE
jgi:RNA polymerase sigma-70 factor (ECF subfamily)